MSNSDSTKKLASSLFNIFKMACISQGIKCFAFGCEAKGTKTLQIKTVHREIFVAFFGEMYERKYNVIENTFYRIDNKMAN